MRKWRNVFFCLCKKRKSDAWDFGSFLHFDRPNLHNRLHHPRTQHQGIVQSVRTAGLGRASDEEINSPSLRIDE